MPNETGADAQRIRDPNSPFSPFSASLVAQDVPQAPERYGKYHLLERIGVGGMAEVWRAKTLGSEGFTKDLVIKRILPKFLGDEESVKMFIDEARLVAKLHHPNIVQIFDFDKEGDRYYLAMELVEGRDLRLSEKAAARAGIWFPLSVSIYIISEALKGLQYAHTRLDHGKPLGIVHRDISPHNLLISFSGDVKISDFGIAKVAECQTGPTGGTVKGKLSYMSPEQITGQTLDARSDVYSMGIIFWELLTRHRLFFGADEQEVVRRVRDGVVPLPRTLNPDIPEAVEKVVMNMLVPNRNQRVQTAAEVVKQLLGLPQYAYEAQALGEFMATLFPEQSRNWTKLLQDMLKKEPQQPAGKNMLMMTPLPRSVPLPSLQRKAELPAEVVHAQPKSGSLSKKATNEPRPAPPPLAAQSNETAQLRPAQLALLQQQTALPQKTSSPQPADQPSSPPLFAPGTEEPAHRSNMSGSDQKTQIATEMPPEVAAALARGTPPSAAPAGARTVIAQAPSLPTQAPPSAPPMPGQGYPPPSAQGGATGEGAKTMIAQAPAIPGPPPGMGGSPVSSAGSQQATVYGAPAPVSVPPSSMAATLPPGARNPGIPVTMRPAAIAFSVGAAGPGFPPMAKWLIGPAIAIIVGLLTTALANRIWPPAPGAGPAGPSLLAASKKIKVNSEPSGATIEINGKVLDSKTPTEIKGDVGATANLKITLAGYDPIEMKVLFRADDSAPLNLRMPKLGSTKAKTEDASQFDTKVGVQNTEDTTKTATNDKTPDKPAPKSDTDEDDKKGKKGKKDKVAKTDTDEPDDDKDAKKGKKGKKGDKGDKTDVAKIKPTLTVTVRPFAMVFIDGKKIQQTPLRDYAISPGSHTILLVNDVKGKRDQIKIKVVAGEKVPPINRVWE